MGRLKRIRRDFDLADLHLRGGDGRTLEVLAVPWNVEEPIMERGLAYTEVFRRGAFTRSVEERGDRVPLLLLHDRRNLPVGGPQAWRDDPAGLVGTFRISKTVKGDETLELVRDNALNSVSVGFRPVRDKGDPRRGGLVERIEARLDEVSLVPIGAYKDARVLAVRDDRDRFSDEAARRAALVDFLRG